jgi:hypothetical protein
MGVEEVNHHTSLVIKVGEEDTLEDTRVVKECGPLNLSKEAAMVMLAVAVECHNNINRSNINHNTNHISSIVNHALNISKSGEEEAHLSKEVVEAMLVVVVVSQAGEDLLMVAHPDHLFPS